MKALAQTLLFLLPASGIKNAALRWIGNSIHPTAVLHPCLVIRVQHIVVGERAVLGPCNTLRDLVLVELANDARVGQWNWLSASPLQVAAAQVSDPGVLRLGEHAAITSRHYVDCSGGVHIGSFTTVAGVRSVLLTHEIDLDRAVQTCRPISIGRYCFISSNVSVSAGTTIGDHIVLAMGAVARGNIDSSGSVYGGVPARRIGVARATRYFARERGYIDVELGGS